MKPGTTYVTVALILLFSFFLSPLSCRAQDVQPTGPYDSLREYIAALEARGKILKIKEVDQDNYEGTAFVYRMLDEKGLDASPGIKCEKEKIDGEWRDTPMYANLY